MEKESEICKDSSWNVKNILMRVHESSIHDKSISNQKNQYSLEGVAELTNSRNLLL
ncbi:hypothetical protein [uncultured Duncaniella sp.]|uniref:hypothetical protein n=1 Tax=uncultured Duncaniella sp. TaxID=2768039 RepID=UPI0026394C66|nr:hypothetical protein [uncultured Duncaniella sp.]